MPIQVVEDPEEYFIFGSIVAGCPEYAEATIAKYEDLFTQTQSVLPESPDTDAVEEWLLGVRAAHYTGPVHLHGKQHVPLPPEERANQYVANVINKGLVEYHSVGECENVVRRMTTVFEETEG